MSSRASKLAAAKPTAMRRSVVRRDPSVSAIVRAWRTLTSRRGAARAGAGETTIVGLSGGADSSALLIALASVSHAPERIIAAHVVHDLRPRAEALADRDAARELATRLGLRFVEAEVKVRHLRGNAEANARRLRYAALARLARELGARFVATAHHAHDQAESVLIALMRGAGPRGLAGVASRRVLSPARPGHASVQLIRPMLGVEPDEARRICREAGWAWREDATNRDLTRLRAAVRARLLPVMLELNPSAARAIVRGAALQRKLARLLSTRARRLSDGSPAGPWDRARLRRAHEAVVGELLRRAHRSVGAGVGRDRLSQGVIDAAVRLIRSDDTSPHAIDWPGASLVVSARHVRLSRVARRSTRG
jgi:tRNA(Ile)-lysidine synthase